MYLHYAKEHLDKRRLPQYSGNQRVVTDIDRNSQVSEVYDNLHVYNYKSNALMRYYQLNTRVGKDLTDL